MLTNEQTDVLGTRAIAAGWKWQVGAAEKNGYRVTSMQNQHTILCRAPWSDENEVIEIHDLPDFRDPVTLNTLRQQVIELIPGSIEVSFSSYRIEYSNSDSVYREVYWLSANGSRITGRVIPFQPGADWVIRSLITCLELKNDLTIKS